jgi:precorrin-2/cobalt-factor-2 C20-methyltransferase
VGATKPKNMGILYGVGVGPGDPGLVTLKAIEVIQSVPTVAFPVHKEGASSRAFETVKSHIREGASLLPLMMPMTREPERLGEAHEEAVLAIIEAARGGDVAYLSLGDPLFYSTFGYLAERFPGEVRVISGVTAMSACAATLGLPLAAGDIPMAVVTGASHEALNKALEMGASVIIMKPRSLSERSLDLLEQTGALARARAAIELGGPGELVIGELDRSTAAELPYFAIIWIQAP